MLAESDQARTGDTIVQPALVDLNCNPQAGRTVGSLRYRGASSKAAQTNVDAALAAATPAVDGTGAILQLGPSINGTLTPASELRRPASGEALTARDTEPVARGQERTNDRPDLFDGEHGEPERPGGLLLRLRRDPALLHQNLCKPDRHARGRASRIAGIQARWCSTPANAEPVGLFFASGADDSNHGFSVANPIHDVLSELGQKSQADGHGIPDCWWGSPSRSPAPTTMSTPRPATRNVSSSQMVAAKSAA